MRWAIWCIHGNLWRVGWILQVSCFARRLSLVCLFARCLKKLLTDSDEIWWAGWVCDTDKLIRFWWWSGSRSGYYNFLSDSSPLRNRAKTKYWYIALYRQTLWTDSDETCGHIGYMTRINRFDVGEDRSLYSDTRIFLIFKVILRHWEMRPKTICGVIFQKCIGPDMFYWIRHCVAEVCALPSALL